MKLTSPDASGETLTPVLLVGSEPLQSLSDGVLLAVHEVALVVVQLSTAEAPSVMVDGVIVSDTVGVPGATTVKVWLADVLPPLPVQVKV